MNQPRFPDPHFPVLTLTSSIAMSPWYPLALRPSNTNWKLPEFGATLYCARIHLLPWLPKNIQMLKLSLCN